MFLFILMSTRSRVNIVSCDHWPYGSGGSWTCMCSALVSHFNILNKGCTPHDMHISIGGGGARYLTYAAFFTRLSEKGERIPATSYAGVSAGAMVGSCLAFGAAPRDILQCLNQDQLQTWTHYPRMVAVACRMMPNMYSSTVLSTPLEKFLSGKRLHVPFTAGVMDDSLAQQCVTYTRGSSVSDVIPAVAASAAVPFVISPVQVKGYGPCIDGGSTVCRHPKSSLLAHVASGKDVLILSSGPWPGFRQRRPSMIKNRKEILLRQFSALDEHGLEPVVRLLGEGFRYRDGIFRYKNVTFVAPTGDQYVRSGGYDTSAQLRYKRNSPMVRTLIREGIEMADMYMAKFCRITF